MLGSFFSRHARPLAVSISLVLAAIVYYGLQPEGFLQFLVGMGPCKDFFCDFDRQYYETGVQLITKPKPTPAYFYSLFFGLGLSVLGRMPIETAIAWWWLFQVISLLLLLLPALELGRKQPWAAVVYLGLVLFSEPVLNNLKWGQVSVFMTGCVLSSWVCYRHGWRRTAVVLLAIPTAIKFYTGIFLIYYLIKKDWRFVIECSCVTAGLLLLPVAFYGIDGNWQFYQGIRQNLQRVQPRIGHSDASQYFPNVSSRYLERLTPLESTYRWLQWLGFGWFGVNLIYLWKNRDRFKFNDELLMALLFLSLPFLLKTSWSHYFVWLPFCQASILVAIWPTRGATAKPHNRHWLSILTPYRYYLLYVSLLLPSIFFFQLFPSFTNYVRYGCVLWANMLLMFCIYSIRSRTEGELSGAEGRV